MLTNFMFALTRKYKYKNISLIHLKDVSMDQRKRCWVPSPIIHIKSRPWVLFLVRSFILSHCVDNLNHMLHIHTRDNLVVMRTECNW